MSVLVAEQSGSIDPKPAPLLSKVPVLGRLFQNRLLYRRLWRYALTSVVATVVSEVTLLLLYGTGVLDATASAVVANLAGTFPSYLMSRYWIWSEADRRRPVRQVISYWAISLVSLLASSGATGAAAANAPKGHAAHLVVVGTAYIGTYALLWVAKFIVYQKALFRSSGNANPT